VVLGSITTIHDGWRGIDLGIWVFGSTRSVMWSHDYWKGKETAPTKKRVKWAKPILCNTPKKAKQGFEVIGEDEEDSISLDLPKTLGD